MSGVTATGSTIADAYVISRQITVFSSVPSGTGCVLPSSYAPGSQVTLCNRDASHNLVIYPPAGDQIENLGVNVPSSLAFGGNITFVSFDPPLSSHPRTWWETTFFSFGNYLPLTGGTLLGELIINNPSGTSLDAKHDVLVGGTLGVTGAAVLSGNATVGGTLGVTGAATLGGGGALTGTFTGNPTLSGNVAVGGTLGVSGAATFGVGSGGVGTGLTVNNDLFAKTLNSIVGIYTLSGTALVNPLKVASSFGGTSTANIVNAFSFGISRDAVNAAGSAQGVAMTTMQMNVGDGNGLTGTSGSHTGLLVNTLMDGPVVGGGFIGAANSYLNIAGAFTGTPGTAISFAPQTLILAGASNVALAEAIEGAIRSDVALPGRGAIGMFSDGTNNGSLDDYAFGAFRSVGKVGFLNGLAFSRHDTPFGLAATASFIGDTVQTNGSGHGWVNRVAAFGVNLPTVNFGTSAWWTPGFQVVGDGTLRVGTGTVAPSATGLAIDAVNYVGSSPTISNAGASYAANDQIYDTNGGILQVDTVNGSGNILTWHYLRVPYAYGGAGPATMALRGGSGNQAAVVGVTWTQETTVSVGSTSATAINLGNASSTTTMIGTVNAGSGTTNVTLGSGAAVATNATTGMVLIPSCAGAPTGNVGALGKVALVYDSTDSKIYVGVAGTWKSVVVA